MELKQIANRELLGEHFNKGTNRWSVNYFEGDNYERIPRYHWVWESAGYERPKKGECLHHIDFDETNDELDNLILLSRSQHNTIHNRGNKYGAKPKSEEHKNKIALGNCKRPLEENIKMIAGILKDNPNLGARPISKMLGYKSKGWMSQRSVSGWSEIKGMALELIAENRV